jgi:hypothetical protein
MEKEEGMAADTDAKGGKKKDRVFPDESLPLDFFQLVDADIGLKAKNILLPRLALDDVNVEMTLKDGVLTLNPIKAVVGGGSFDGRVGLYTKGNVAKLDVSTKVEELNLGPMLSELGITDAIEGYLDAEIELAGHGESVAEIMAELNGKVVVVMGNGRINNKYLSLLGADLSSGVLQLINPLKEKKNYTELNCFVGRFDITDGLAKSTALVLDTGSMSIIGDGEIDLETESLDLSLKPSPKKGVGTSEGRKATLSLGELAKPFKLGGTLANPKLAIDTTQSAIMIGKAYGGIALFGPLGIVAALASSPSGGDQNPCLAAIEAAGIGVKVSDVKKVEGDEAVQDKTPEDASEGATSPIGEAGQRLKKLFNR